MELSDRGGYRKRIEKQAQYKRSRQEKSLLKISEKVYESRWERLKRYWEEKKKPNHDMATRSAI